MRALVLVSLAASAASSALPLLDNINSINLRLRRRRRSLSSSEYCATCLWKNGIVCESRAQYLVRELNYASLQSARDSLAADCNKVVLNKVELPLEAFCEKCPWLQSTTCLARAQFLVRRYPDVPTLDDAKAGILEKGECVDPDWEVPDSQLAALAEEDGGGGTMSTGSIVGIIFGITAFLLMLLAAWAYRRKQNENKPVPKEISSIPVCQLDTSSNLDASDDILLETPQPLSAVVAEVNGNFSNSGPRKIKKERKKTISFAMDHRPDPVGRSECAPKEDDNGNVPPPDEDGTAEKENKGVSTFGEASSEPDAEGNNLGAEEDSASSGGGEGTETKGIDDDRGGQSTVEEDATEKKEEEVVVAKEEP